MNKKSVNAVVRDGEQLFREGKTDEAIGCFRHALEIDPNHKAALNDLGVLFYLQGEIDKAAGYFARALKSDPFYFESILNYCDLLKTTGYLHNAIALLEMALQKYPDNEELVDLYEQAQIASQERVIKDSPETRSLNGNFGV